jgi:hypothetical protein
MNVFVSYSRRDNPVNRLIEIESHLRHIGNVYIDDLHHPPNVDRHVAVKAALMAADAFVAVISPNYLHTPWTRYELSEATNRSVPLLLFTQTNEVRACRNEDLFALAHMTP